MAIKFRNTGATREYVLREDRDSETPTKFIWRRLRWDEMDKLNHHNIYTPEQAMQVSLIIAEAKAHGRGPDELTAEEALRVNEVAPMTHDFRARMNAFYGHAIGMGLLEVRDALDESGKPTTLTAEDFIAMADAEQICEVGSVIVNGSKHSETDAKK